MNKTFLPIAVSTLTLSLAGSAVAGPGCGMYKGNYRNAMMTYGMHHPYGMPRPYSTGHYGSAGYHATKGYGSGGYDDQGHGGDGSHAAQPPVKAEPNLVEVAASAGSFETLITAVKAAGLAETLMGEGPFTVFAPTDEAFAKLPEGALEALLADKAKLTQLLKYHVVPGKLDASAVGGVSKFVTVEGSELPVANIKITKTDVMASNGVIHAIDEVLIPGA